MTASWRNKVKTVNCPWGCGKRVDTFIDDIGLRRYLDVEDLPETVSINHPTIRWRLWEWRGKPTGWCLKTHSVNRDRPLRVEHICDNTPKNRRGGI